MSIVRKPAPRRRLVLRVRGRTEHIGQRPAAVARLLLAHPRGLTRLEMLSKGPPGLALGAPTYIARLREAGAPIESVPETGSDTAGRTVRFVRYIVAGPMTVGYETADAEGEE